VHVRLIGPWLRREMRIFALIVPFLPALCEGVAVVASVVNVDIPHTRCNHGAPWWVLVLVVPLVIRSKVLELRISQFLKLEWRNQWFDLVWHLITGSLAQADWFLDGIFPLQLAQCGPEITEALLDRMVSYTWLTPLVKWLGFLGVAVFCLTTAMFTQLFIATAPLEALPMITVNTGWQEEIALAASVAGFEIVSAKYQEMAVDSTVEILLCWTVVLVEHCPQMMMKLTFFAFFYKNLNTSGRAQLWVSLAMSLITSTWKMAKCLKRAWQLWRGQSRNQIHTRQIVCITMPLMMMAIVALLYIFLDVLLTFFCDSHDWTVLGGCKPQLFP